jgi:hypothetical protein
MRPEGLTEEMARRPPGCKLDHCRPECMRKETNLGQGEQRTDQRVRDKPHFRQCGMLDRRSYSGHGRSPSPSPTRHRQARDYSTCVRESCRPSEGRRMGKTAGRRNRSAQKKEAGDHRSRKGRRTTRKHHRRRPSHCRMDRRGLNLGRTSSLRVSG